MTETSFKMPIFLEDDLAISSTAPVNQMNIQYSIIIEGWIWWFMKTNMGFLGLKGR